MDFEHQIRWVNFNFFHIVSEAIENIHWKFILKATAQLPNIVFGMKNQILKLTEL